ncbi:T9SS type A sorting domain-containing protein [Cryomorpha ignava]|uniref:T9SS type A sorting domain-containing protein n=1 Tax=Cryomorpha ignava TaxID=101383 RepID=A0A7K3WJW9_9FLAO|nr:T9SS type A sorting domain-containing protein [Cryomorpha ignava]NEN21943.1 T9SS type A sorting domain-containing protein [Cryomorpha ignava]
MCRNTLFLALLFFYSQFLFSQENQLVYKKVIPGSSFRFVPSPDSLGYAITYQWQSFGTPSVDIGVWSEIPQNLVLDGTTFTRGLILYDFNFEPTGATLINALGSQDIAWLPSGQAIINFNRESDFNTTPELFPTIPTIDNYPSPTYGQNVFIRYDPATETNIGLLNFSVSFFAEDQEPFNGYNHAVDWLSVSNKNYKNTVVVSDSILISYVLLDGEQTLNNSFEFTNWGGQVHLVRLELNLNTNELTSQQIGSSTGSQFLSRVESSPNMPFLWRAGIVRGNDTPISISGAELEMASNDSLYHVYITKESITGETEWLTELYAYNNLFPDTALSFDTKISVRNHINNILNKNDNTYISSTFSALSHDGDTLLFRNHLGQDNSYIDYFPSSPILPEQLHISYSEASLYKIDDNGNVTGKLSYTYDAMNFFNRNPRVSLYDVEDRLAWVQSYIALNDTTIVFTLTESDGSEQTTNLSLPAGKGTVIIWLDEDLSILNQWIIPYQHNIGSGGLSINAILPYRGDTLLIQGMLGYNTSSDLNPFAETELITTESPTSFFAFYSAPEIFTSTEKIKSPTNFKVYPNPSSVYIRVSGAYGQQANFKIFDLSGRIIQSGNISQNELISTENLNSGMYMLWIDSENGGGTAKFVVE